MIRRVLFALFLIALLPTAAAAQTVIAKPDPIFGWMQPVTPGDTTLPTTYQYTIKIDSLPEQAIAPTCSAPVAPETRWRCEVPLPILPTGSHSISVMASVTVAGTTYKTPPSTPLTALSVLIAVPQDLYIRDKDTPAGGGK